MACLLRLTHKMADGLSFRYFKIEINFIPAGMGMRWHSIPYRTRLQFRQSHLQLTGFDQFIDYQLIDPSLVGSLQRSQVQHIGLFQGDMHGRQLFMRRGRVKIKPGRFLRICRMEDYLFGAFSYVQGFLVLQDIFSTIYQDGTGIPHINHPELPAVKEMGSLEGIDCFQDQIIGKGHSAPGNIPFYMGIYQPDITRVHYLFYQKFLSDPFRIISFKVFRMIVVTLFKNYCHISYALNYFQCNECIQR